MSSHLCIICGHNSKADDERHFGTVRGNTERFKNTAFRLWKCSRCHTIHSLDSVDFAEIYADYPLNERRLDLYARGTFGNLLRRLRRVGVKKTDTILDYGCGNGIFIRFLRNRGYKNVIGYDPYIREFAELRPDTKFDCIVLNDVIEHVADPREVIRDCISHLERDGVFYIGTADSEGVDMTNLEPHIMRLHQPFHRVIITQKTLNLLARETGLELVRAYRRSYMDTLIPFVNYRFLDEFSRALGHNMDKALDPSAGTIVLRRPKLLWYAFFGFFSPSAFEPAVVLRKPA